MTFLNGTDPGLRQTRTPTVNLFTDGVDFTAGSSTQVTLTNDPGSENNLIITFDGVTQHRDTYSVSGTTVTFDAAIPSGVVDIEATFTTTIPASEPGDLSVTTAKIVDSSVTTAKIADSNITTAKIADSNITTAKIADSSITEAKWGGNQLGGRRNLLINGAMQVAQRGTSFTGVTSGTDTYGADRFYLGTSVLLSSTYDITNSSDSPDGFSNSFKIDCQTIDTSLSAGEYIIFNHKIEAQNLQHLAWGTSGAKQVTLSFWVKSNKTATYFVELEHGESGEINPLQWTINSADTWEYKSLTFSGNTSSVINNDNGIGLSVSIWLTAGSTYTSGTYTADTWHSTNANRIVGIDNFVDSTSNYINFTGVQLEVGDVATPFEHRSYGEELSACQRYYQVSGRIEGYPMVRYENVGTGKAYSNWRLIPEMRAAPTVSFTGNFITATGYSGTPTASNITARQFRLESASSVDPNDNLWIFQDSSDETEGIVSDAEL